MRCPGCGKEIVFYSVSRGATTPETLDELRRRAREQNAEVIFNPPPIGPYRCPGCRARFTTEGEPA